MPHRNNSLSGQYARDQLIVIDPQGRQESYELRGHGMTLGRSAENSISMPSRNVSRKHAQLRRIADGWQLIDMGGANGTFVGSRQLTPRVPHQLRPLEQIAVGDYFVYWQPIGRNPQAWDEDAELAEPQGFSGWYIASGLMTLAIMAVGVWFLLQFNVPAQLQEKGWLPTPNQGEWTGEWQTSCEWLPCGDMELLQTDNGVTGRYLDGTGTLHGVITDDKLVGIWLLGGASGAFEFTLSPDERTFTGTWDDQWQWCGAQSSAPLPTACNTADF